MQYIIFITRTPFPLPTNSCSPSVLEMSKKKCNHEEIIVRIMKTLMGEENKKAFLYLQRPVVNIKRIYWGWVLEWRKGNPWTISTHIEDTPSYFASLPSQKSFFPLRWDTFPPPPNHFLNSLPSRELWSKRGNEETNKVLYKSNKLIKKKWTPNLMHWKGQGKRRQKHTQYLRSACRGRGSALELRRMQGCVRSSLRRHSPD